MNRKLIELRDDEAEAALPEQPRFSIDNVKGCGDDRAVNRWNLLQGHRVVMPLMLFKKEITVSVEKFLGSSVTHSPSLQ